MKKIEKSETKLDKKVDRAMKQAQCLLVATNEEPISVHSSQRLVQTVDSSSESERVGHEADEIEDKVDEATIRAA